MEYQSEYVHISSIVPGDTIRYNGHLKTVCKSDIKKSEFMGLTIFGDSFKLGYQLIEKINIQKALLC